MIVPFAILEAPAHGEVPPARTANLQESFVNAFSIDATSVASAGYKVQEDRTSD